MDNDEIMKINEVAEYLKMNPQTIYNWAQQKKIPAVKLGKKEWRFKKSVLDIWFDQHYDRKFKECIDTIQKNLQDSATEKTT